MLEVLNIGSKGYHLSHIIIRKMFIFHFKTKPYFDCRTKSKMACYRLQTEAEFLHSVWVLPTASRSFPKCNFWSSVWASVSCNSTLFHLNTWCNTIIGPSPLQIVQNPPLSSTFLSTQPFPLKSNVILEII